MSTENSNKNNEADNFAYGAQAEASATWGWGKASASGNVSTSTEIEEGEERTIKRTIENINVGRTLNFVFRQMNQVFVSVLHIVDVRIAFRNGDPADDREYTLPELQAFLEDKVRPDQHDTVRQAIWQQLFTTFDWQGNHRPLVEAVAIQPDPSADVPGGLRINPTNDHLNAEFWRFRRQTQALSKEIDGAGVSVPGAIIGVTSSTLPTDGVVVDALLGQGNALDAYSMGLQMGAVDERRLTNRHAEAEIAALEARTAALTARDEKRAAIAAQVFGPPPEAKGG